MHSGADEKTDAASFAEEALRRYPLTGVQVEHLADSFNTIYRIRSLEGDFALRVGPADGIHRAGAGEAETGWTAQLDRAGLAVPCVVRTTDGADTVIAPDRSWRATLLTWLPGTPVPVPPTRRDIEDLGELSARLHEAAPSTATLPRGVLDARDPFAFVVPVALSTAPEPHHALLGRGEDVAREAVAELWATADEPPRVIHFDLTPRNVVRMPDGGLGAIDFQDMAWGHRAHDIAHSLFGATRGEWSVAALEAFRAGYSRHAPWPAVDEAHLRRLFVARRVSMINLTLALRRPGHDETLARHLAALAAALDAL
ncbi:phosphotransferase [Microbacterium sp. CFH 90308]|uniref:Phosphotransferase n=1 Tax=Microbacterium salsuginis TaxID=2722803 RepID=A0ABX1KCP7_9MICO|nr:phosphotransferase [Microbacterium sp. CFH 90308]